MLYKRPGSPHWQIKFRLRGISVRESSGTMDRKAAETYEEKLRKAIWSREQLGVTAPKTWDDAVDQWFKDKGHKRSIGRDRERLEAAGEVFKGLPLTEVTQANIRAYGALLAAREGKTKSTANRHLSTIRALLNAAKEWEMYPEGVSPPKVKLYPLPKFEPKPITREQFQLLLSELCPHQLPIVEFAAETGLRLQNVLRLRWEPSDTEPFVDPDGSRLYVPPSAAKAGSAIAIPLSTRAWDIIRDMERSKAGYVFIDHRGRAPVGSIRTSWEKARVRAGLPTLRFHDLRHTWASWHIQSGTPTRVLQELGGWADETMVRKYAHLSVEHLRKFVK